MASRPLQPTQVIAQAVAAYFQVARVIVDGFPRQHMVRPGLSVYPEARIFVQRGMVLFQCRQIVSLGLDDLPGDRLLAAHGIDGDQRAVQVELRHQLRWRADFIGFARNFLLGEHQACFDGKGAQQMDGAAVLSAATQGLAIQGVMARIDLGQAVLHLAREGAHKGLVLMAEHEVAERALLRVVRRESTRLVR